MKKSKILFVVTFLIAINSCGVQQDASKNEEAIRKENIELFKSTMLKHLDAVSSKDLKTLKSTMSPNGNMQLILPNSEIRYGVDKFMEFHKEWFKDPNWTFETKILKTRIKENLGMAIVEIIYREPERNGKPYFNRMIVSYVLEKIEGQWYVIKDHASSVEKTSN